MKDEKVKANEGGLTVGSLVEVSVLCVVQVLFIG
jgi:hypothetical protein